MPYITELRIFDNSEERDSATGKIPPPKLLLHWKSGHVVAPDLARPDFRTERNAGPHDAVGQRRGPASRRIVSRVDLADMRRVRAGALKRVVGVAEIVVSPDVGAKPCFVFQRGPFQRRAAAPPADHACRQQFGIDPESRGLLPDKPVELRHALLEPLDDVERFTRRANDDL